MIDRRYVAGGEVQSGVQLLLALGAGKTEAQWNR
jgi:hypothetical protein